MIAFRWPGARRATIAAVAVLLVLAGAVAVVARIDTASASQQSFTAEWLLVKIPGEWSARGATGSTVAAGVGMGRWSRAVSLTAAPFHLPEDLGQHETAPSIPRGEYQIFVSGFRASRHGTRRGPARLTVSEGDRVELPPPGVGVQLVRTRRIGDRTLTAVVSVDRHADLADAIRGANRVLDSLRMID